MSKYEIQVKNEHYKFLKYVSRGRWDSYYDQIFFIEKYIPNEQNILEIGGGLSINKFLLSKESYNIKTADIDKSLQPDYEMDLFDIFSIDDYNYNWILAFQVLEHIEYEDFLEFLKISSLNKKKLLISLPYVGITIKFAFYMSLYGERKIEFIFRIPLFFKEHRFNGQHYWEVGKKGYSVNKIKQDISNYYNDINIFYSNYNKSQVFFKLSNRNTN